MASNPRPPDPPSRRGNVVALIAIAALAAGLFLIVSAMQQHNATQNCIDSGRRDCVPLPTN